MFAHIFVTIFLSCVLIYDSRWFPFKMKVINNYASNWSNWWVHRWVWLQMILLDIQWCVLYASFFILSTWNYYVTEQTLKLNFWKPKILFHQSHFLVRYSFRSLEVHKTLPHFLELCCFLYIAFDAFLALQQNKRSTRLPPWYLLSPPLQADQESFSSLQYMHIDKWFLFVCWQSLVNLSRLLYTICVRPRESYVARKTWYSFTFYWKWYNY